MARRFLVLQQVALLVSHTTDVQYRDVPLEIAMNLNKRCHSGSSETFGGVAMDILRDRCPLLLKRAHGPECF